jgi:hypothetical protein
VIRVLPPTSRKIEIATEFGKNSGKFGKLGKIGKVPNFLKNSENYDNFPGQ